MTEQLLERELRALFDQGPNEAPAAAVDGALASSRVVAQRRPRFARLDRQGWPPQPWSVADPDVRRTARAVLVLAVVALLAAAVLAVGARLLERPRITATLVSGASLNRIVRGPMLTTLSDGRLLVLGEGGAGLYVMFFDPRTGASSGGVNVGAPFDTSPSAWPQPDGRILLVGSITTGIDERHSALGWLDPQSGAITVVAPLLENRFAPAAAVLPNGHVLVSGGADLSAGTSLGALASVEVLLPGASTSKPAAPMAQPRLRHSLVVLGDGRVLIVGGDGTPSDLAVELYDETAGTSTVVGRMAEPRHIASGPPLMLADGSVLIPGGPVEVQACGGQEVARQAMYRYDPASQALMSLAPLPHFVNSAVALTDDRVLVFGSYLAFPGGCAGAAAPIMTPWLGVYEPGTGTTVATADSTPGFGDLEIALSHRYESGALLPDGRVALIADDSDHPTQNPVDFLTIGR